MLRVLLLCLLECHHSLSLTLISKYNSTDDHVICYYELDEIERLKEQKTYSFLDNVYSGNITYTCDKESICCGVECCSKIDSVAAFIFFLFLFFIGVAVFYICYARKTPLYRRIYIIIRGKTNPPSQQYEQRI